MIQRGENANNLHARLAFDIIPEATIGAFGMIGEWDDNENDTERDFSRYGFDVQADFYNMRVTGAYLQAKDDKEERGNEQNNAWYLQAFYVFQKDARPLVVPAIRFDSYEEKDGEDEYDELTLNVTFYFTQNIKGFAEYWTQTDKPSGVTRDNRFTIQIAAAF